MRWLVSSTVQVHKRMYSTPSFTLPPASLFINGQFVDAENGSTLPIISPRNGEELTTIANASNADVDRAISSARKSFDQYLSDEKGWPNSKVQERADILRNMSAELMKRMEEFAWVETIDSGKPKNESRGDIEASAQFFEYYADLISNSNVLNDSALVCPEEGVSAKLRKEPLGVIGCITPWNFPLMQAVVKVAPALAAGCSLVLKPSPLASLTCLMLAEVARDSGLPPGALNVLTGGPPGSDTGIYLGEHPELDKMSFTGSSVAGSALLKAAAPLLRPTGLELGGKGAMVVLADADLDTVVDWAMVGCFLCAGQVCSATSRLIVDESIVDELIQKLVEATKTKIVMGDPLNETTNLGPVVSAAQQKKISDLVSRAHDDSRCEALIDDNHWPKLEDGYFVNPQIFRVRQAHNTWPEVWKEEVFGPILCISSFRHNDLSEAVELANESPYGLGHAVMGTDLSHVATVSKRLRAGVVWENCSQPLYPGTPFGGCKQSGFGREYGELGLEEFIHHKTVISASPSHSWNWYN